MRSLRDLRYGPGAAGNLLDLYLPEAGERPAPVVVWSSGSGWMADDGKEGAALIAPYLVARGYAVCGVTVRSSAQAIFPAQLEDVRAAIDWLREQASEHELDPERIASMGNSSGGWVALMAGLEAGVQAVVDLYAPTDFLQMDAHMLEQGAEFKALLGIDGCHAHPGSPESLLVGGPIEERRELCARANPIAYVRPGAPPMLILHGRADPFVPHHQSELLFDALREHGNHALFYSLSGVKHEHSYLDDPTPSREFLVRETRDGEERVVEDAPPPTWETIERFVRAALERSPSSTASVAGA